ncbi:MAG: phosphatidylglycerophosphatase A [Ignavibacteria bacterium]|nr:phosphatidylglycerophosphatase A [Ignavibacteria bacterium]
MNKFEKFIGSGFGTGFIPFASGTFGSFAALILYWIPGFENIYIIAPLIMLTTIYGVALGSKFEIAFGKDPSECTIDEVAGMWISLLFLPKSIIISVITFFVWRIFDIVKPSPVRNMEKLPGGYGIMLDDVMGGIYTCLLMNICVNYIAPGFFKGLI